MKQLMKMALALMLLLAFASMAMADSAIANAKPIRGGDTRNGAILLTEAKYAQVWEDEARYYDIRRWYKLQASADGTYNIWVKPLEEDMCMRVYNEKGNPIVSEIAHDEYVFSVPVKKGDMIYLHAVADQTWYKGGRFIFSVCFDGYHAPSAESEIARHATCSAPGEVVYPCLLCGQPGKTEEISKLPHTLGNWQKEKNPGCTATGLNVQRCTVCGDIVNQQEIPAVGHGTSKQVVTKPATCMQTGVMSEQCTVCLETLSTQTLPMTDHTPGIMKTVLPASCTMNGRGEQRCTVCNALLNEETTSAYGHNFSEWETIVEATKEVEGQRMRYCYNCASVEYEKIEKLPKFLGIF